MFFLHINLCCVRLCVYVHHMHVWCSKKGAEGNYFNLDGCISASENYSGHQIFFNLLFKQYVVDQMLKSSNS